MSILYFIWLVRFKDFIVFCCFIVLLLKESLVYIIKSFVSVFIIV